MRVNNLCHQSIPTTYANNLCQGRASSMRVAHFPSSRSASAPIAHLEQTLNFFDGWQGSAALQDVAHAADTSLMRLNRRFHSDGFPANDSHDGFRERGKINAFLAQVALWLRTRFGLRQICCSLSRSISTRLERCFAIVMPSIEF
jgi:hypothetical protein